MKKHRYLLSSISFVIIAGGLYFFLQPNLSFIRHACFMESIDTEFGIHQNYRDKKCLLKQRHSLLPHLRRQYIPFSYQVPNDLHVRLDLLQQPSNSVGQLRKDAEKTQARLASFLNDFSNSHPDVHVHIPLIKPLATINHLLVSRWEGDASRITDYARATLAFPTIEKMYEGLEEIKESGLIVLSVVDSFKTPCLGGYRDITIIFRDFVNGHIGEIQLNTHKIMDFKMGLGTELFHIIRQLMAIPKVEKRPLTESESICLDTLFAIEKQGYDTAYRASYEDPKLESSQKLMAIYTGSFDPPTKAHKEIILKSLEKGQFDQFIVYVNQFGKKKYKASVEDRKKMLEIMLKDHLDKVAITIQTQGDKRTDFRKLRGLQSQLTLVVGEDSYQKRLLLPSIQLAECDRLFVIPRNAKSKILAHESSPDLEVIPLEKEIFISSTAAREKLFKGELPKNELEPLVLNYVLSKGLYSKGEMNGCAAQ